jgi:DNA-binding Lrp family transcriptional regulator
MHLQRPRSLAPRARGFSDSASLERHGLRSPIDHGCDRLRLSPMNTAWLAFTSWTMAPMRLAILGSILTSNALSSVAMTAQLGLVRQAAFVSLVLKTDMMMIGVVLDRSTPDSFAEFEKAVTKVSGCMECHVITGEFDYFMIVRTRDNESFNRLHAEQLLQLPGVRQVRSFMGLKQVLSTTQFPV